MPDVIVLFDRQQALAFLSEASLSDWRARAVVVLDEDARLSAAELELTAHAGAPLCAGQPAAGRRAFTVPMLLLPQRPARAGELGAALAQALSLLLGTLPPHAAQTAQAAQTMHRDCREAAACTRLGGRCANRQAAERKKPQQVLPTPLSGVLTAVGPAAVHAVVRSFSPGVQPSGWRRVEVRMAGCSAALVPAAGQGQAFGQTSVLSRARRLAVRRQGVPVFRINRRGR